MSEINDWRGLAGAWAELAQALRTDVTLGNRVRVLEEAESRLRARDAEGVEVRIAVAMDSDGDWNARGGHEMDDETAGDRAEWPLSPPVFVSFVTARVPRPQPPVEVQGEVTS